MTSQGEIIFLFTLKNGIVKSFCAEVENDVIVTNFDFVGLVVL